MYLERDEGAAYWYVGKVAREVVVTRVFEGVAIVIRSEQVLGQTRPEELDNKREKKRNKVVCRCSEEI